MLIKTRNSFGDLVAVGSGRVFQTKNRCSWEFKSGNAYRISFILTTACKQFKAPPKDGETQIKPAYINRYETIQCVMELKNTNKNMYSSLRKLNQNETLDVKGIIREESYTDKDGLEHIQNILYLESVFFPDRLAAMINGGYQNRSEVKRQALVPQKAQKPKDGIYFD